MTRELLIPIERAEVFDFVAAQDVLPKALTAYGLVGGGGINVRMYLDPGIVRVYIALCTS